MTDHTGTDAPGSSEAAADALSIDTLHAVVELQRTELNRLLREQSRLNDRIDSLLRLHEREQVLRQQMQASLDRLAQAQFAITAGGSAALSSDFSKSADRHSDSDVAVLHRRLERTENRFNALQDAVGSLVSLIERQQTTPQPDNPSGPGKFVRVYAP